MKNEDVHCGGTLTWREFKKYNFYARRKLFTITSISFFIILFLLNMILFRQMLLSFTMAAVFALILWILITIIFPLKVRNEYSSNQLIKQEIQYDVTNDEVVQTRGKSKTFFQWEDFISAYEHKDMFRVHISKNQAVVLPKRFFKNDDEISDFRRLISTSMHVKKVHLSKQQ